MKNFITNSKTENLKKRLVELIKKSEELKFLVGFFYFSGISELYEALKTNPDVEIKVLVGLNVDKGNKGLLELAEDDKELSDEERSYKFLQSVKKSINSEHFDTKEFYEQVRFFINRIKNDKLIIRKTYNPNHAKIYIFKLNEDQIARNKLFVTGSSNLTRVGLTTQEEFNVEISDYGVEDAEEYFDNLWHEAVKITEDDVIKKKLLQVVEEETLVKDITPFEAFILILKTYLDSFEPKEVGESLIKTFEANNYVPYKYQLDAVAQALAIIEKNNGVIVADVVGLGKTVVACSIAKELRKRGLVIAPPGLVGDNNKKSGWKKYTEEFGLYDWEVRSLGDLENVSEYLKKAKDIEVVIIDEAHRFRNQDTKDYEYLKNICRNKIVILLTATPFNNQPGDIFSLLKLFVTPKKSSITLENNLVDKFKHFKGTFDRLAFIKKNWNSPDENKRQKAENYFKALFGEEGINLEKVKQRSRYLSKQIRDVIEPVTIRRNRLDLQKNPYYKEEVKELSEVKDPREWFFELTETQSSFYDKVLSRYFADPEEGGQFKGAIYRPFEYEQKRKEKLSGEENFQFLQQRNLYDFMRRLLVKRFESSFGAFEQSLKNFKRVTENVLEFIKKTDKYILDRGLLEKIYELDVEDIEKELENYSEKLKSGDFPKSHKVYKIKDFIYEEKFIADIESDLKLYDEILFELKELELVKNDPKVNCLIENVQTLLRDKPRKGEPGRKVIIFSEFTDTVIYLKPILERKFKDKLLTVDYDLSARRIEEINSNFDASHGKQEDEYQILLSTDKISEGYNLNRAGMVVNYDIPWNPVRVIQRVGRINRISKKVFSELYIVNFFPTEKGATIVKSREIAQSKMFLIHNTLGEDAKIFDIDEEPTAAGLFKKIQRNPDDLEEESFYTKALKKFIELKKKHPEVIEALNNFPPRIKVAKKYSNNELLVFLKKGRMYMYGMKYTKEEKAAIEQMTLEEVFGGIECEKNEKPLKLSARFWDSYEAIKNYRETRSINPTEQSLEQRSLNNLKTLITKPWDELLPLMDFVRVLREDITDYGTLSDYTLRRLANLEFHNDAGKKKTVITIKALETELGRDYLQDEKERQKELKKEIIVAIENQSK